ncbi:SdrD B-like domain-containing protein [Paeniglutamicibacter sp. R2-26]|uniref:SdrD B-like domain-containing protein n=1 Tax=Paeniglutamicibacter sp. R2-26 TaxID=3144417 RepID=UPI003EE6E43B
MRKQYNSGAPKRWRSPLAALLALTLGLGMAGMAPAVAAPVAESSPAEAPAGTRASDGTEADESSVKTGQATPGAEAPETKAPAAKRSSDVASRADGGGMNLSKVLVGPDTVAPGGFVTYEMTLGCSSNTDPCTNAFLEDTLPEPLVFKSLQYSGFAKPVSEKISGRNIRLDFNEPTEGRDGVGINDGSTYTVTLVAQLPADASPEFGGQSLVNSATLTSDAGTLTDSAKAVTPVIDAAPRAAITKNWAKDSVLEKSGAENLLTLGGIKNTSKVGATSLTIKEPSGNSEPFAAVEFAGFGEIVFPEGADTLEVTYLVGSDKHTATPGNANAPPSFPKGLDLSTITGLEFTFKSSASTTERGGIVANGKAGSLELKTTLRAGAPAGTVANEVSITAETPKGNSKPVTATDAFVVDATSYAVSATKSFSPAQVVAGDGTVIGEGKNRSTVSIGAANASNQPLTTLGIKEPGDGTSPFGEGIDFEKFVSGTWPTGATSGVIIIDTTPYKLGNANGQLVFPGNLPSGRDIKAFEITFAGEFAPGSGFTLDFDVLGTATGNHANTIEASGTPKAGGNKVTDEATSTLTVVDQERSLTGLKYFTPNRVEGIPGDRTQAILRTHVDSAKTNVDVRKIVQTDDFESMTPTWKPLAVSVRQLQGATHVVVETKTAGGEWRSIVVSTDGQGLEGIALPAGTTGVRITYERETGSFPAGEDVAAIVDFELTELIEHGKSFSNILTLNHGKPAEGAVTADKEMKLASEKSWTPSTIVQKPSDLNPRSTLQLSAVNTSAFGVDSLTMVDPKAGETNPFDYVDITGFKGTVAPAEAANLARATFTFADGTTSETFQGQAALNPVLPEGRTWADVTGFAFGLEKQGTTSVPRDARFDLAVGTALRSTLRTDGTTSIDAALAALEPKHTGKGYILPNTAEATIKRAGDPTVVRHPSANLEIVTKESVDISSTLTKEFSPAGPATFFTPNGVPAPIDVTLKVDTGRHEADRVVFEDKDATFWNAFDFAGWAPLPTSNVQVTIEYLTGGSYARGEGNTLEHVEGTWSTTEPSNGAVQGIRVTMQGRDYTELDKTVNKVKFKVVPRYTLRSGEPNAIDGTSSNPGETTASTVSNTATATVDRLGKAHNPADATDNHTFVQGKNVPGVAKTSDAANGLVAAGRELNYTITVKNTGTEVITDPVVTDKLPVDAKGALLDLEPEWKSQVKLSFAKKFEQAPEGTSMTTDRAQVGIERTGDTLSFTFPAGTRLYPGESYTIEIPTTVRPGVAARTKLLNTAEFTGTDSKKTEATHEVGIIEGQAYASRKLVREVPSAGQTAPTGVHNALSGVQNDASCYKFEGGFYRYPCIVETKPGGIAEWKLSVTNTGNVPAQHLEILDVFPFVGDTGVTSSQAGKSRGSMWSPTLLDITLPAVPEGATSEIHYLTGDPAQCKPTGQEKTNPWAGCNSKDIWTTVRPANPREIHGLKLVVDFPEGTDGILPGEGISLSFKTQSDTELPSGAGELAPAWNSFGYAAEAQVNGKTDHRGQEPIKTGITFRPLEKEKVSVGDYVWVDTNRDGRQDEGEPGIKDVVLKLVGPDGTSGVTDVYGNEVLPAMTDGSGKYSFEHLPVLEDGQSYTVVIDQAASRKPLAPFAPTEAGQGNREGDSSLWSATTDNKSVDLTTNGANDPTLDFGFVPATVSVGDFVWVDTNRDGRQDAGEPGIEGVVLELRGPDGTVLATMSTDKDGRYLFENLPVLRDGETYTVDIDREASAEALKPYVPATAGVGEREGDSSLWTASTDPSSDVLTKDAGVDPTLDFGFVRKSVSVGDFVWLDSDLDGRQGKGEPGIPGVVLDLFGPDGSFIRSTTTDEHGKYSFDFLPVLLDGQKYTVRIDKDKDENRLALKAYVPTTPGSGDREGDSSSWEASTDPDEIALTENEQRDPTLDFGFVPGKVSVGDKVWVDTNKDGIQDEGEPGELGIPGVVLDLYGPDGKKIGSTTTDKDGNYLFKDLPVLAEGESYTVKIVKDESKDALWPYIPTTPGATEREKDSSDWETASEGLNTAGDHDGSLDFGFVEAKVSVGDYVWVDENRDGRQDEGEPGIEGVVLELRGPDGTVLATMSTDKDGWYLFKNLPVLRDGETYTVDIDREASAEALKPYVPATAGVGERDGDSSLWTASTDPSSDVLTKDAGVDPTLDFGFVRKSVSVGDFVWLDSDLDGRQGKGEPGIPGVVLDLFGPDGSFIRSTTTDEHGKYSFDFLPVLLDGQKYTVKVDKDKDENQLALKAYVPTTPGSGDREGDSSSWEASSKGLTENGDRDPTLDFGFVPGKVSVGDKVWVDTNKDGIQDEGEPGIPGVVLDLYGPDGKKIGSTTTDKDGKYLFKDLPVLTEGESYVVKINREKSKDALEPYVPTVETGGDRGNDSSSWESVSEGLNSDGESDLTLDFGFVLQDDVELPTTDGNNGNNGNGDAGQQRPGNGSGNTEKPETGDGDLAKTGFTVLGIALGGLLLILGGLALKRRRVGGNES